MKLGIKLGRLSWPMPSTTESLQQRAEVLVRAQRWAATIELCKTLAVRSHSCLFTGKARAWKSSRSLTSVNARRLSQYEGPLRLLSTKTIPGIDAYTCKLVARRDYIACRAATCNFSPIDYLFPIAGTSAPADPRPWPLCLD